MPKQYLSLRNIQFLLYEVHQATSICQYAYYGEHNKEIFDMVLGSAKQLADKYLHPYLTEMDRKPPYYENGQIYVHQQIKQLMKLYGDGGWISATSSYEEGGQQLPIILSNLSGFIFGAANYSASVFPFLSTGASNLIRNFGSQELKDTFIPKMYAGEWQGTMALTEPQAGSSLSDVQTTASPTESGHYLIKGQKIFISAGDHDAVENVVHLLLARIKGAPAGVKGISLFVVPKKRVVKEGVAPNDVITAGMYHKMGYKGAPIAHLIFGEHEDCHGYLVGEPHKGLNYMFQMMNEARLAVGMSAVSIASAAYYASLEYAKERPQGRTFHAKNPLEPQVAIIEHPDIRRMLLFQKAIVEGSLSLLMQCSLYADLEKVNTGETKERYALLLDLLTPVAKSYPSEMAIQTTSVAIQCLGGYGYLEDFTPEQFFRDTRIHPIHEGTTGIQGLDLLGRKVIMHEGRAMSIFLEEIRLTLLSVPSLSTLRVRKHELAEASQHLQAITMHLVDFIKEGNVEKALADATLYLEYFGIIAIAWQWLKQGLVAEKALESSNLSEEDYNFYQGKMLGAQYFFEYEIPKIRGLHERLESSYTLTPTMKSAYLV
ncbi:MAG: acyl-CoA dehydrogenase [Thermoflexibacter sp.]|jgi:butyryl-CoA dehydrogenase|nr:acyl-CoA dehydrogenase [Thermoflexibacter sp.]